MSKISNTSLSSPLSPTHRVATAVSSLRGRISPSTSPIRRLNNMPSLEPAENTTSRLRSRSISQAPFSPSAPKSSLRQISPPPPYSSPKRVPPPYTEPTSMSPFRRRAPPPSYEEATESEVAGLIRSAGNQINSIASRINNLFGRGNSQAENIASMLSSVGDGLEARTNTTTYTEGIGREINPTEDGQRSLINPNSIESSVDPD